MRDSSRRIALTADEMRMGRVFGDCLASAMVSRRPDLRYRMGSAALIFVTSPSTKT
jgi:hypothetical protein